jgi:MoaA/NifB/PqqE/SkfB family radical SAM enzyme
MKLSVRLHRVGRMASKAVRALVDRHHPILAHLIAMRRCNLSCAYCNEYDAVSKPVPLAEMWKRVDKLAELGTDFVTISGGEPLMHPELEEIVARIRKRGMVPTLITNGYYLSRERIEKLNRAGLDHLQISIDNVEPDEASMKSLRLLEPKLQWLAELRQFTVTINSVLGSGVRKPEDALVIARRAKELGFTTSLGIIHDGNGQLKPLVPGDMAIYEALNRLAGFGPMLPNRHFQRNLALGQPNAWSCRAGSRYLYVDEDGLVHYCSQQRGAPGIPLEKYTGEHVRREYYTKKACAPYCTINCVQQVALADNWRSPQRREAALPVPPAAPAPAAARTGDEALAG